MKDSVDIVRSFYDDSVEREWQRLDRHYFEFEINKSYMEKYIRPGDRVLDVGGGPGRYSLYLAEKGADVTLLDLSEANVAFAKEKAKEAGLSIQALGGDARYADELVVGEFDSILLMGPLYHLLEEKDRIRTVNACLKRLRKGGTLFVSFISLFAGMIYAASRTPGDILIDGERPMFENCIRDIDFCGKAFTEAVFILPKNILPFMAQFPLAKLHLVNSESITMPFEENLMLQSPEVIARWLDFAKALCEREEFYSYAAHFLYVGRKE